MSRSIRYTVVLIVLLALAAAVCPAGAVPAASLPDSRHAAASGSDPEASFVVDDPSDDSNAHDKSLGDGVCASWYNTCTLRAAVEEAGALGGADTITFASPLDIFLDPTEGELILFDQIRLDASGVWDTANDRPGVSISGVDRTVTCLGIDGDNNEVYGLFIYNCSNAIEIRGAYNTIGGPLPGYRNVLSGNALFGIDTEMGGAQAHHNVVRGNWIGLSISGDTASPNRTGVHIANGAHDNTIGGDAPDQGNYISGNHLMGVEILTVGSDGNRLGGNVIGLPAVGNQDVGNGCLGVAIVSSNNNQIGGSGLAGNTISRNGGGGNCNYEGGVLILGGSNNNMVDANAITDNAGHGVRVVDSSGSFILGNIIAGNLLDGVHVRGTTATGNTIWSNSIHDNGGQGIALSDGGNGELPAPVITSATPGGASGTACASCRVYIHSDSADEGGVPHGSTTADGSGNWTYSGSISGPNATATNTDGDNNTSEFSAPVPVAQPCTPLTGVSISGPASGLVGMPYTFQAGVTPPDAGQPITYLWSPEPGSGQGTAGATYTWSAAGSYGIHVAVSNCGGAGGAAADHSITISAGTVYRVYLPTVARHHGP